MKPQAKLNATTQPWSCAPSIPQVYEATLATRGSDHPDTLASLNNLANALHDQGKHAEAEGLYRQALEARRRVLGADHPDTLTSLNNLVSALVAQHKLTAAQEQYAGAFLCGPRIGWLHALCRVRVVHGVRADLCVQSAGMRAR